MKKQHNRVRAVSVALSLALLLAGGYAHAATSPDLGFAESFGILAGTYTNTVPGTTINGDLGYTTPPAVAPTVNGTTYQADGTYAQAGIDQNAALADLNSQPCTHTFAAGAVDLASNVDFPSDTYGPGVYCVTGALSIGGTGITLDGPGTYIFRTDAALDTVAGTVVTLAPGVSECDVWWTATGATTLGANSTFAGTVIDAAGITVGSTVTWNGRALAFGGTVTTDTDTITSPACAAAVPAASLTVTKTVVNDDDGTLTASDFPLFVGDQLVTSGVATTTLAPGSYTVTETADTGYAAGAWGGDCAADGTITLADGEVATCTITNDDIAAAVPSATLTVTKTVVNDDDGTMDVSDFPLFINGQLVISGVATTTLAPGTYMVSETGDSDYDASGWGGDCAADGSITLADGEVATCTITNDDDESGGSSSGGSSRRRSAEPVEGSTVVTAATTTAPTTVVVSTTTTASAAPPGFPNTGGGPSNAVPYMAAFAGAIGCALALTFLRRRATIATVNAI